MNDNPLNPLDSLKNFVAHLPSLKSGRRELRRERQRKIWNRPDSEKADRLLPITRTSSGRAERQQEGVSARQQHRRRVAALKTRQAAQAVQPAAATTPVENVNEL